LRLKYDKLLSSFAFNFSLRQYIAAEGSSMSKKATLEQPPVVPTPDVLEISRDVENDQFLIIASDGLWAGPGHSSTFQRNLSRLWVLHLQTDH
jgi:serine/threonine protein phosphatase PrpC